MSCAMSSASNQPPRISSDEYAASREDFELFRRLLRVARLLKSDDLDPPITQYDNGADGGFLRSDLRVNTSRSIGNAAGMDNDYNHVNDEECDEDDEDEEDGEAWKDSTNAAAIFSQPVGRGKKNPQLSRRKQPNKQQDRNRGANQRQPQRQQLQPQHHHAAVEKRYRSVVNCKIRQLNASIPTSNTFILPDPNAPPAKDQDQDQAAGAAEEVPTKSVVLDRAIQYINHLVTTYKQYETERNELRRVLQLWLDNVLVSSVPSGSSISVS